MKIAAAGAGGVEKTAVVVIAKKNWKQIKKPQRRAPIVKMKFSLQANLYLRNVDAVDVLAQKM